MTFVSAEGVPGAVGGAGGFEACGGIAGGFGGIGTGTEVKPVGFGAGRTGAAVTSLTLLPAALAGGMGTEGLSSV